MIRKQPAPQGNPYNRPDTRVEYQIFSEDYFSGADVNIFFGDVWVDEAISLQFGVSEKVLPIYGYQSFVFDTVVRGQRIVQGSFGINFKTAGYLQQVLDNSLAVDYAIKQAQEKGVIKKEDFKKYKLDEILTIYGKESFNQIAQEYEEALWGVAEDEKNRLTNSNKTFFPADPYGFDLKINYGAVSDSFEGQSNAFFTQARKFNQNPNMTVEVVNGVQVMEMQKTIATSMQGQPITEMYSFIAKDINAPLYSR